MKEEIFYRVWDKEEEEFIQNSTTKATMWKTERGAVGQRGDFFYRFERKLRRVRAVALGIDKYQVVITDADKDAIRDQIDARLEVKKFKLVEA